jgi:Domain of unknown function (DUF4382)
MRVPQLIILVLAMPLALAGCGDEGGTGESPGNSTRILLTDNPFPYDRVERVDIYVVTVSGSLSSDTSAGGSFVTLATPNRRINLLALQNGITDELGEVELPEGVLTAIRVVIDTDSSSITLKNGTQLTATSTPGIAWQFSAGRPTLSALVEEQITVPDSGATVVIDYDVGKAFITPQEIDPSSTDSGFIFSPVLRAADANRTGSIAGVVQDGSGGAVEDASLRLYFGDPGAPENTWPVLGTAQTDGNGAFRFSFVTRSGYWDQFPAHANSSYIVAVDPPTGSGLARNVVINIGVTAMQETSVGTVVLP